MKRDKYISGSGESELDDDFKALLENRRMDDPGNEFWDSYYDSLSARMKADTAKLAQSSRGSGIASRLANLLLPRPRLAWQIALGVFLLSSGILVGRFGLGGSESDTTGASDLASSTEPVTPDIASGEDGTASSDEAIARAHAVLGRSRTLLLGMVNFDVSEDDPSHLAINRRRNIARSLIDESAEISSQLAKTDQLQLNFLLTELEVILLQIANLGQDYDLAGIEMIQKGVNKKSLLFKIDIAEMRRLDEQLSLETRNSGDAMSQI